MFEMTNQQQTENNKLKTRNWKQVAGDKKVDTTSCRQQTEDNNAKKPYANHKQVENTNTNQTQTT